MFSIDPRMVFVDISFKGYIPYSLPIQGKQSMKVNLKGQKFWGTVSWKEQRIPDHQGWLANFYVADTCLEVPSLWMGHNVLDCNIHTRLIVHNSILIPPTLNCNCIIAHAYVRILHQDIFARVCSYKHGVKWDCCWNYPCLVPLSSLSFLFFETKKKQVFLLSSFLAKLSNSSKFFNGWHE